MRTLSQVRILSGPGMLTFTASMTTSPHNNHSAQVTQNRFP